MPVVVNVLLIATMIEMTKMVGSNSVIAKIKLEKMLLIERDSEPVAIIASVKIPAMLIKDVSRLITIKPIIKNMKTT